MLCSKNECKSVARDVEFLDIDKQLGKCELCAYRKLTSNLQDNTYRLVRLEYVNRYWRRLVR